MTNNILPLNAHTLAAIIALEYLTHSDDHSEFAPTDDQSLAEILADDLADLYHNSNIADIFNHYFFEPTDDTDIIFDRERIIYELLESDDTITDLAAAIITTNINRPDPFAAFR